ncbi:MAG: hypothetical protein Q4C83_02540 [Candidatus Saccharibacteria bacterium]|nr:hypothetical protein [Candidatus Saccharibacteria bacterium]
MSGDGGMKPTVDSATGEIVGGLAGLRELVRLKQMQESQKVGVGSASESKLTGAASVVTTGGSKKKRRRNRNRRTTHEVKVDVSANNNDFRLPFKTSNVVYAELGLVANKREAKLYVINGDKLFIYTNDIFGNQADAYYLAADKMLRNFRAFDTATIADIQVFINRKAALTDNDKGLVCLDKYQIISSSERVLAVAKKILNNRKQTDDIVNKQRQKERRSSDVPVESTVLTIDLSELDKSEAGPLRAELKDEPQKEAKTGKITKVDKSEKVDESVAESEIQANNGDLIDQVLRVQAIAKRVASDSMSPRDAMELFLILGKASASLLEQVLDLERDMAESLIDQLRRMHALDRQRSNGEYPILIKNISELGKDISYTLQSQADNYRSAVHVEKVRGRKLIYDLDELFMVKVADEYMERLADFCRNSSDHRLSQLFSKDDHHEIRASEVLRAISADQELGGLNTVAYDEFHSHVTKYMLAAGWLINNPTDSFPWFQFQVDGTDGLKIDTLRYLAVNLEWIIPSYSAEALLSLAQQVERLELDDDRRKGAVELKLAVVAKIKASLAENNPEIATDQLTIDGESTK